MSRDECPHITPVAPPGYVMCAEDMSFRHHQWECPGADPAAWLEDMMGLHDVMPPQVEYLLDDGHYSGSARRLAAAVGQDADTFAFAGFDNRDDAVEFFTPMSEADKTHLVRGGSAVSTPATTSTDVWWLTPGVWVFAHRWRM